MLFNPRCALDQLVNFLAMLAIAVVVLPTHGQERPSAVTWDERIEVASGSAFQGSWRMNESRYYYVDDPTIAIDNDGGVGVAWVDQTRKDIFFQSYSPDGKSQLPEPVNVSSTPEVFSWLPRIVIPPDNQGQVFILWQEIVFSGGTHGGEIFFSRSTDGGQTFSDPANLSNSIAGDGKGRLSFHYWHNGSLDLAIGPASTLYTAWTEYEGALWFSRSSDLGRSFAKPLRVEGGGNQNPARGPSLAVGDNNDVYLAWTVGEDPGADIHIAKSDDAGSSFSAPGIVVKTTGHSDAPKITVDSKGIIHLVFAEGTTGPDGRYYVAYTRSMDGALTFEEPRDISKALTARFGSGGFPSLAYDNDNLYLLWELFPRHGYRSRGLGFTYSADFGKSFALPSVVPGSVDQMHGHNGGLQGLLMRKLAVNRTGSIAVVNSTFRESTSSHIWLYRGRRSRH